MSDNQGPRNTAFEEFKRSNPNVKALGTYWRGSPEHEAWMTILINQEKEVIKYVENEQVTTFYRDLDESELKAQEEVKVEEKPALTTFEVLGEIHNCNNGDHQVHHVKLARPFWWWLQSDFVWVEYVFVERLRVTGGDAEAGIHINHTQTFVYITTEEAETIEDCQHNPIYAAPGWLEIPEAMWGIGEIALTDPEENNN